MLLLRMALAVCPSTIAVSVSVHRAWKGQAAAADLPYFSKDTGGGWEPNWGGDPSSLLRHGVHR